MRSLGYVDIGKRVGVQLNDKECSSWLVLDRDGAILMYSSVSQDGLENTSTGRACARLLVILPQIDKSKQDRVVQGYDIVIIFTFVSIEVDTLASVHCNNQQMILEEGFVRALRLPNGQVMISQPRMLGKQVHQIMPGLALLEADGRVYDKAWPIGDIKRMTNSGLWSKTPGRSLGGPIEFV